MGMQEAHQIKRFLSRTIIFSLVLEFFGAVILAMRLMADRGFPAA
jgi:hypothetical protein